MRAFKGLKSPACQETIVAYDSGDICLSKCSMVKTFSQALVDALESTGIPLRQVAEGAGVSYEQLKKVRQRQRPTNVDDAVKVANFFGVTLEEFIDDQTATVRSDIVDLYNQLSDRERQYLRGSAKGIIDNRDRSSD